MHEGPTGAQLFLDCQVSAQAWGWGLFSHVAGAPTVAIPESLEPGYEGSFLGDTSITLWHVTLCGVSLENGLETAITLFQNAGSRVSLQPLTFS